MYVMIFDTETTSLNKPFCYNIGYCVYNTDTNEIELKEDFVVEQIWHNIPLFSSAYYADKRPIYINRMKSRKVKMEKFGFITQRIYRIIKSYAIEFAYAYNSKFDEKVFNFNCDFFKVINPFDTVKVFDIRGMVHNKIAFTSEYKNFCESNNLFTDTGNYSTTAESVYKFITNNIEFEEEHTALSDAIIETEILEYCITKGCNYTEEYKTYSSIPRTIKKDFIVYDKSIQTNIIEQSVKKVTIRKGTEVIKIIIE